MERSSTIAELMERRRIQAGAKEYQGHTYMDLVRFDEATKHMIIFDVLTNESLVGWKGERNRLYLSEAGYQKALDNQKAGNIKIISHANVARGNLYYDRRDIARQSTISSQVAISILSRSAGTTEPPRRVLRNGIRTRTATDW